MFEEVISKKQGSYPYYATIESIVQSNVSHNPYTEFFRGNKNSSYPIICEREAGTQVLDNSVVFKPKCYKASNPPLNMCWQYSCSLIRPCKINKNQELQCESCGIYNNECESYTNCDCNVKYF
jgi:hypothetical protein